MNLKDIIDELESLRNKADAYDNTAKKLDDAHEYCKKFLSGSSWGKNVWHAILDDAIRLREEKSGNLEKIK